MSGLIQSAAAVPLYGYQQQWLLDNSRFKIGKFARQTGKTFTTTLEIVDAGFEAEVHKRRSNWLILSRGERQAREAIEQGVMLHAKAYNMALKDIRDYEIKGESGEKYTALEVRLPGGSVITAVPANPDTVRGFSRNMFFDEFAFHQDARAIWGAAFPIISNGFKCRVTSTPNGKGNKFYEIMTGTGGVWSKHVVDIHRAVAEGLPRDIAELKAGLDDDDLWSQEYELHWLDEASAWLSFDLINGCEHDRAALPALYANGMCYVGVDIGRRRDLFVIWVAEMVGDVLWTREIITLKRGTFAEQDALLAGVFLRYRVARCCMDQTGMGEKPVEDAQRLYGSTRVEGVLFTSPNKLALANAIKQRFQGRTLRIPLADQALRSDLHKVKQMPSDTGAPRFIAESDSAGHADRFWAAALCCEAASTTHVPFEYIPAPPKGSGEVSEDDGGMFEDAYTRYG